MGRTWQSHEKNFIYISFFPLFPFFSLFSPFSLFPPFFPFNRARRFGTINHAFRLETRSMNCFEKKNVSRHPKIVVPRSRHLFPSFIVALLFPQLSVILSRIFSHFFSSRNSHFQNCFLILDDPVGNVARNWMYFRYTHLAEFREFVMSAVIQTFLFSLGS